MRKTLFAAAALAPLCFLAAQTPAAAQTTISSSTGTPVTTAADGDITIASGGSVSPSNATGGPGSAAVTLNSNNSVSNAGTISYKDVNNVVGVAIQGGNTGSFTNSGTITVNESFTPKDSNSDGVNEGPFASTTSSGRFGVQLTGTAPFVGNIANTGAISVQGSNDNGAGLPSYGVSLEAPLQGSLSNSGTITYIGDGGGAVRETGGVTGDVLIVGAVSAQGEKSNAVNLAGDVGGRVSVYSSLISTDYGTTTRSTSPSLLTTIQSQGNAEVNPDSGSALVISGNVGAGVFIGAAPANTNASDVTTDADGDGIVDGAETAGSITTYGEAPALVIGGPGNIVIGSFVAAPVGAGAGTGDNNFGLIIEGAVTGSGVYDGVPATGLQIGAVINPLTNALTCGGGTICGTTSIPGGVQITGSVEATAFAANATAIHIGAGATISTIENTGTIGVSISPPNTTSNTFNSFSGSATAILIDAGSSGLGAGIVSSLINSGTISAVVTGDSGDAVSLSAVVDRGGGLSSVTNTGAIRTSFVADATGATAASSVKSVALDLSANTTGITFVQQQAPNQIVTTTTANSITTSVVTTSPATTPLVQDTAATVTTTTNGDTTVTTTIPASPVITGDILLGSGSNTVNILAGTVTGALSLGSGATGSVTIDNGAIYSGAFTYTGGALALNVNNGTFENTSASASAVANVSQAYNLSSLNVGKTGIIYFGVDPANINGPRAAEFLVSGAATIASGAQIGLTFVSNATGPETFTIVKAASLSVGETDTALNGPVPYIFNSSIATNAAQGTITLTISPKTAQQLGLNPSQAAALPATYQALTLDAPVQAAFLNQYTRGGFLGLYNQILPDYAGGTFQAANAASQAISRATAENNNIENPSGSRGAWMQEIFFGVNQGIGLTDGFRGGGFGFVGGVETGGSGLGAFGTTIAFVSTNVGDSHIPGDSQTSMSEVELGGYWQGEFDGLVADARVGAGYSLLADRREIVQADTAGDITLDRKVKSDWDGYTLSGHFGLAYKWVLKNNFLGGGWFIQPQTHIDYFSLNESSYHDNEAEGGPALAMAFDSRSGQETSGTASIVFGRRLGTGLIWRPSLEVGVRDVFSGDAGDTTARFLSGGPAFTLTPADIEGAAGIARFKLKASSEYYELGVEAGGEVLSSRYEEGDVKASFRVLF